MKNRIILLIFVLLINGCSCIPIEPQATRVVASSNPAPKECRYVGEVIGKQGNLVMLALTSNKNLEQGAMNDLKNQTSKMGANYVQIILSRAGNSKSDKRFGSSLEQTNVTNSGHAYSCPPSVLS